MEIVRPAFSQSEDVPNQLTYTLPTSLGSGIIRVEKFSSGLNLYHMDLSPIKPITIVGKMPDRNSGISFNLTGHSEMRSSGSRQSVQAIADSSIHYTYPTFVETKEAIGCSRKVKIAILFDSETLSDLADDDEEPFLPFLKGLQENSPTYGRGKTRAEIRKALNQLISCPYTGKTRALYLEGKTMEIFAGSLEQIKVKDKTLPRQPRINKTDTERIHYAVELLVGDPVNPPDLTDLAAKIGMSRSKFFRIFKLVFGHSPMDHLRSHRLQTARQLLRQGRHNVTEAAVAVGFNNLSYFARVFNAEFGVPPHQTI